MRVGSEEAHVAHKRLEVVIGRLAEALPDDAQVNRLGNNILVVGRILARQGW